MWSLNFYLVNHQCPYVVLLEKLFMAAAAGAAMETLRSRCPSRGERASVNFAVFDQNQKNSPFTFFPPIRFCILPSRGHAYIPQIQWQFYDTIHTCRESFVRASSLGYWRFSGFATQCKSNRQNVELYLPLLLSSSISVVRFLWQICGGWRRKNRSQVDHFGKHWS